MRAVELFCGCGGISVGLQMAGFEVIAGVDIKPKCISTYSHNFGKDKAYQLDLTKISPSEFMNIIRISTDELDLLAGGPPCQGFSKIIPPKLRYIENENNLLVKYFLNYCIVLKPKMILMENVDEMKNGFEQYYTNEIVETLKNEEYTVTHFILNAADYGVPQRRRRAFFLANRNNIQLNPPPVTNIESPNEFQLDFKFFPPYITVWDAIGDLPSLKHGEGYDECEYACEPFSEYQFIIRRGRNKVRNHISRCLPPIHYKRLASLKPGEGLKDLPQELKVKHGYSGAYGRLTKKMIAPTITSWVFHPGSGRWGHPVDIRLLSIREVARIQSFPDDFEFVGTYNEQAGQLGNAAPPLLVQKIVESMISQLYI
ncbi:DNA cytosine methyltransferase [Candidatus Latescibacterota bacterium]